MVGIAIQEEPSPHSNPRSDLSNPAAKVKATLPLRGRWSTIITLSGGRLILLTVIWTTWQAWMRRSEASEVSWFLIPIGPFVIGINAKG